jgi:hypothetical protein
LLLATGCGIGDPPVNEAARALAKDAKTLESFVLEDMKVAEKSESSNAAADCPTGSKRQTYHTAKNFPSGGHATPMAWIDAVEPSFQQTLVSLGYEKNSDASRNHPGWTLLILRKKNPEITFTVLLKASNPNIEITGETGCLAIEQ